jgi:hypothetical protein
MDTRKTIQARSLTPIQLKMLDIGAPVIVTCETLTGEKVAVRLQTANLEPDSDVNSTHAEGCWLAHGAYVAIMPEGSWE